ncbi:translation elongation factor Ts [Hyphomicrobium sulfonivorans]|uniref:translation elongation factor Ts n=1 Tax=Hyphomicrobium sulfonivorans TaxID=121290 RepID=UPI0015700122|nr:translation elongation factor Ts [Hyphomicrobium sulfonivorans]MBI1650743.1 elongation factor Ts [Hyphomicrobium sulfonivorans]NSL71899.1 elongation factor Ts [Hyphomicrobium sulfonivorans]
MTISASLVKELREKTGAGMMDCKAALTEVKGDIEAAIDWLRKKGLSKAAKKADRVAAEGLIGVAVDGATGSIVEVNSETDFVARNDQFQDLVTNIAALAGPANGDAEAILVAAYPGKSHTVGDQIKELIATIGENMNLRRAATLSVPQGVVGAYVHGQVSPGLGKIGVLVALESSGSNTDELATLARQIAMHVAATNPIALDIDGVPAEVLEREKAILADKNQGKPPQVLEKIVASGVKSYAKDNTLLEQSYIHDPSKSVGQTLKESEGKVGGPVKIASFVRYGLGEGIEKKEDDFAAEVAAAAGN